MFIRTTTLREEYREPYWEDGHWVFDRYNFTTTTENATTTTKNATSSSSSEELDPDTVMLFAEETPPPTSPRTTDAIDYIKYHTQSTHKQCNVFCLRIYIQYGVVCATRIIPFGWEEKPHRWEYDYRTFDNICEVERENCIHQTSRPEWRLKHPGRCETKWGGNTVADFTVMPQDYGNLVSRAAWWGGRPLRPMATQQYKLPPVQQLEYFPG